MYFGSLSFDEEGDFLFDRKFLSNKKCSAGCAARGKVIYCFAIPLARERVASDSLFCRALSEVLSSLVRTIQLHLTSLVKFVA